MMNTVEAPVEEKIVSSDTEPLAETDPLTDTVSPQEAEDSTALSPEEELARLRGEIDTLRAALEQKQLEQEQTLRELGEFHRLFPDIAIKDVPDRVWESVERGIPLSAAYALYEKQELQARSHADLINRQNATRSAGKAGRHTSGEYFSPDEVRAMSQKQVHENYAKIMDSMKHWR